MKDDYDLLKEKFEDEEETKVIVTWEDKQALK